MNNFCKLNPAKIVKILSLGYVVWAVFIILAFLIAWGIFEWKEWKKRKNDLETNS